MTSSSPAQAPLHTIADVERDTGLSKDTLRVWERRYGFPTPSRDPLGERQYDDVQLHRLRKIRRLLDAGHRPGQVVKLSVDALDELDTQRTGKGIRKTGADQSTTGKMLPAHAEVPVPELDDWMQMLRSQDAQALRLAMTQTLLERGLARLITECVVPMNVHVGQSWLDGQLAIYEEHLYTEILQGVLRHAMGQISGGRTGAAPRVLLTTLPGEPHSLGLLMAECFMALEGCQTVPLGTQTPLPDIVLASQTSRADIVALGFTAIQNPRDVRAALSQLRERLPAQVEVWAGGRCPALYRPRQGESQSGVPAYWHMEKLEDIPLAVARWRAKA